MDLSELRAINSLRIEGTNTLGYAENDGLLGVGARTSAIKLASAGT